jgi:hypothetical protein
LRDYFHKEDDFQRGKVIPGSPKVHFFVALKNW